MVFAHRHGFRSIGIDLNAQYCKQTVDALESVKFGEAKACHAT